MEVTAVVHAAHGRYGSSVTIIFRCHSRI